VEAPKQSEAPAERAPVPKEDLSRTASDAASAEKTVADIPSKRHGEKTEAGDRKPEKPSAAAVKPEPEKPRSEEKPAAAPKRKGLLWAVVGALALIGILMIVLNPFGANGDGESKNEATESSLHLSRDGVSIAAADFHTVGLKSDGTVVAAGEPLGNTDEGQLEVSDWRDVVAVYADSSITLGLKSDGTVVGAGDLGMERHRLAQSRNV